MFTLGNKWKPGRPGRHMKKKSMKATSGAARRRKGTKAKRKAQRPAPRSRQSMSSPDAKAEIRRLKAKLAQAMVRIEQLQTSADTDFLLDIPNRRGFERELNRAVSYIKRYRAAGALIVLDIDRLKPINDTFGHGAGDQVLKAIARVLLRQIRASDVIGRLGGDEFGLLLWNLTEADAHAKAAALEGDIDRLSFVFDGRAVGTGASTGVAVLGPQSDPLRALEQADCAMYVRKAQRRHEVT
jgi:diguanylate cyclase (GGDEF)-like protein